jgi:outer membrane lipoprotein SlyB
MVLDVQSITIAGRRYLVSTEDMVVESATGVGKNRRTAEAVGGGAALGGIIGAIAGGGKGAAIGVLVGGTGGAGAQVLTRGRDVQVPAETLLTFRLDKPVSLQADQ